VRVLAPFAAMSFTISTLYRSPMPSKSARAASIEISERTNGRSALIASLVAFSIFSRSSGVNGVSRAKS
jgi:hypothetical protein